jgi:plastocyanin
MKRVIPLLLFALLISTPGPGQSAAAASYMVQMTDSPSFVPASLSIAQGETVIWTNSSVGAFHTSTSGTAPTANGLWNSGPVNLTGTYTVTFTNFAPGVYPYFCSFHYLEGMTGSLTITNAAPPPPFLSNPVFTNLQFHFTIHGTAGLTYVTESSSNLRDWAAIETNLAPASALNVIDPFATNAAGFYRVHTAP